MKASEYTHEEGAVSVTVRETGRRYGGGADAWFWDAQLKIGESSHGGDTYVRKDEMSKTYPIYVRMSSAKTYDSAESAMQEGLAIACGTFRVVADHGGLVASPRDS